MQRNVINKSLSIIVTALSTAIITLFTAIIMMRDSERILACGKDYDYVFSDLLLGLIVSLCITLIICFIYAYNNREKFIQACLNWRKVYIFWAISFIVFCIIHLVIDFPLETKICQVIWWIIGSLTTLVGIYQLIRKKWLDGLLYLCLFLFPIVANYIGSSIKVELITRLLGL